MTTLAQQQERTLRDLLGDQRYEIRDVIEFIEGWDKKPLPREEQGR